MWETDWTITEFQNGKNKKNTQFQSIRLLCPDLKVSLLSNFE